MKTDTTNQAGTQPEHFPPPVATQPTATRMWFAWAVPGFFLMACYFQISIFGFNMSGWTWLGGFLCGAVVLLQTGTGQVAMPFQYWMPWVAMVLLYLSPWFDNALQSAAQIVCPLLVGMAASTLRPSQQQLDSLAKTFRAVAVAFLAAVVVIRLPMLLMGRLPEAISAMIFQSFFLCSYLLQRKKIDLVLYLACAAVPVIALTRGPVLGSMALVLLTLAPLSLSRRLLIAVLAILIGLGVFYSARFQQKMFWSGRGTLSDVSFDNPNMRTHTRDLMWRRLWTGVQEKPWLGHGGNADATDLLAAGFPTYLPHNDWVRILFNYGIVGCALYVAAMLLQLLHGRQWAGVAPPSTQVFLYAALTGFVPYMAVMFTDNILIYAQFYGNLHFLLLGLGYGSLAAEQERAAYEAEIAKQT